MVWRQRCDRSGRARPNAVLSPRGPGAAAATELRGYVGPEEISPFVRQWFPETHWPYLSPYFEHRLYRIFVEVRPYAELIRRYPDELNVYRIGQVYCTCYGSACVDGEAGHHHLSQLIPIWPERFAAARAAGWELGTP